MKRQKQVRITALSLTMEENFFVNDRPFLREVVRVKHALVEVDRLENILFQARVELESAVAEMNVKREAV